MLDPTRTWLSSDRCNVVYSDNGRWWLICVFRGCGRFADVTRCIAVVATEGIVSEIAGLAVVGCITLSVLFITGSADLIQRGCQD